MNRLWVLICATLLLLACGDDDKKKLNTPANLTANVATEDQVNLIWEDHSRNEAGFEIQRALKGETFRILTRTNADTTTIKDKTVALGAVYRYRVRAVSDKERSYYSNTAEVEVVVDRASAPMPPTSLQATEVTSTTLTLTWVDTSTNETSFEIERSLQEDFAEAETLAADMNETRYEDSQLTPGTQYYYRIRAINDIAESPYSQTLAIQTSAPPQEPPPVPSDLSAEAVSSSQITLEWTYHSTIEARFILMTSLDGLTFEELHTTTANTATYNHEELSSETTYYYYVIAFNSAGESEHSAVAQATTQAEPVVAPSAPVDLNFSELTSNSVRLTWADTSDNEEGFRLERSQTNDFEPVDLVEEVTLDANTTTYQDNNMLSATRYFYRIVAFNAAGDSDYSNLIEVQTPPEVPLLTAPSALAMQDNTPSSITLSWQDNSNGEEGFRIFFSTGDDQPFVELGTTGAETETYTHNGLPDNTTYHYRVLAYWGEQTSDYSNTLEATTDPLPINIQGPPTLLEAAGALAHSIDLRWQDNSDTEAGFLLERAAQDSFPEGDTTIIEIEADQEEYTDTGLTPVTLYHYRIRAFNADGYSDYSESISWSTVSEPIQPDP